MGVIGQNKLRFILFPCWNGRLVNINWDTKTNVFAGTGNFWSTHDELHFCPLWHGRVFSVHVEMHFVSSLVCSSRANCVYASMSCVWSTQVEIPFVSSLDFFKTCLDAFCVPFGMRKFGQYRFSYILFLLADIGEGCSTKVETYFMSSLECVVFGQQTLCPRWHGRGLVNSCWD